MGRTMGWTGVAAGTVSIALWLLPFLLMGVGGGYFLGWFLMLGVWLFAMPVITGSLLLAANRRNR